MEITDLLFANGIKNTRICQLQTSMISLVCTLFGVMGRLILLFILRRM